MCRNLILLIALFTNLAIAGDSVESIQDVLGNNDSWNIAKASRGEFEILLRYRNKLVSKHSDGYPRLFQVYWDFPKHSSGMPSNELSDEMRIFEDRIVDVLEGDFSGILVATITGGGYREWVFYTKSVDDFAKKLHNMPQNAEPYPIQIETKEDLNWKYFFDDIRGNIKE